MEYRDFYAILGVVRNADEATIKSAYRQLVRQYHPDVSPRLVDGESRIREINEAYSVLSDTAKRDLYDAVQSNLSGEEMGFKAHTQDRASDSGTKDTAAAPNDRDDSTGKQRQPSNDQVSHPVNIELGGKHPVELANAAQAVREEYRATTKWKHLRCRKVTPLDDKQVSGIYILHVGSGVEFDWTWEGALAFRPTDISEIDDPVELDRLAIATEESGRNSRVSWYGEVVEVNEADGDIYVAVEDFDQRPYIGSFYVRPFEFLEALKTIYSEGEFAGVQEILQGRLIASKGGKYPLVPHPVGPSISQLYAVWKHAWGILWGPPGTGKTYTIGEQVAACLADPSERILVVSTTNKATDGAAISIGQAVYRSRRKDRNLVRIGKNADYDKFDRKGLAWMLAGGEAELQRRAVELRNLLKKTQKNEERAKYRKELQQIQRVLKDRALKIFLAPDTSVVISTAFRAITLLKDSAIRTQVETSKAPFTTVIIDEAGLLPRVTAAALSLLASRRVLLVGDPMQLAPIGKMSRILPTVQATWLAQSGLSHLDNTRNLQPGIHLLTKQYRMHPDIRKVVSEYQYDGMLEDADSLRINPGALGGLFGKGLPRALWYVLDEDGADLPSIRAERGPANRSWMRQITRSVLEKLLVKSQFSGREGLFISPFAAQAADIRAFLAERDLHSWTASTVHSQQGAEAEIVIFDTVNASSTAWPPGEWKRLVNVGISRAKEQLIVIASRSEMQQPFLRPLAHLLTPCKAVRQGKSLRFVQVPAQRDYQVSQELVENGALLGNQINSRKEMRLILSSDQQRLSRIRMDGKPRLVRGVAGSGKTMVLANWLSQVVKDLQNPDEVVWVVFANYALKGLIEDTIQRAWDDGDHRRVFPWQRVQTVHIDELLSVLMDQLWQTRQVCYAEDDKFDYDAKSELYLRHFPVSQIQPRCSAMFIDEAQDMGAHTLRLLAALVSQSDPDDANSRAINIFYDNAQNVYGRSTPKWSDLGLDMRGRSTVMRESFRSTKPITEYALNVLYSLQPPISDPEHRELVERQLIEKTDRDGRTWWQVRFAQTHGPVPVLKKYQSLDKQIDAIAGQIIQWVKTEAIIPGDICLLYNSPDVRNAINGRLVFLLKQQGITLELLTSKLVQPDSSRVLATTTQSFKGYDAEIVVIVSADRFVGSGKILANVLYTAMTRARSVLYVYTNSANAAGQGQIINNVLTGCLDELQSVDQRAEATSPIDDMADLLNIIGPQHESWLRDIWRKYKVVQEPLLAADGEILAEPVFWFHAGISTFACFGSQTVGASTRHLLEDHGIVVLMEGQPVLADA
ncbi:MAG: AAA family ATPase [Anaerolinea sp.]|nr:AAA family ATPase [Anaerolinea sp.]